MVINSSKFVNVIYVFSVTPVIPNFHVRNLKIVVEEFRFGPLIEKCLLYGVFLYELSGGVPESHGKLGGVPVLPHVAVQNVLLSHIPRKHENNADA